MCECVNVWLYCMNKMNTLNIWMELIIWMEGNDRPGEKSYLMWDGVKLTVQLTHGDGLGVDGSMDDPLILLFPFVMKNGHCIGHRVNHWRLAAEWLPHQHEAVGDNSTRSCDYRVKANGHQINVMSKCMFYIELSNFKFTFLYECHICLVCSIEMSILINSS